MAKIYSVVGPSSSSVGPKSAASVTATAAIRPMLCEFEVGSSTAPADVAFAFGITRFSAAGTSTPYTPNPIDPADPDCVSVGAITYTAEPTIGVDLYRVDLNQRATYRWVCQDGRQMIAPATANNGLTGRNILAGTALVANCTLLFSE